MTFQPEIPPAQAPRPLSVSSPSGHQTQLFCIAPDAIATEIRVAGLFALLFGQHLSRGLRPMQWWGFAMDIPR